MLDDYTVRVNLNEWRNTVPLSFCEGIAPVLMISKEAYDKNGPEWVKSNPVGTGPFKFVSFTPDVGFKAEKFPDYWVEGKPYLDGIEITFVADQTTAEMLVKTGQVDFAGASLRLAAEYEEMGLTVVTATEASWVLVPDTGHLDSPWANQKVREAAEYAIDRDTIAEAFFYGYAKAPNQIPPPSAQTYNPNFPYSRDYNAEKAKQLLIEAGYPGGFDTTIICFPAIDEDIALAIQADLKKVGIIADLEYTDFGKWLTYFSPMSSAPNNSLLYLPIPGFDSNYVTTMQFIMSMFSQSWERTPEWVKAVQAAMAPLTPEVELTRACTDIISRDALLIPVHLGVQARVAQPNVMFKFAERGYVLYWNMEDAWIKQ
jgi:ABC-type transport system substrate-binding protein